MVIFIINTLEYVLIYYRCHLRMSNEAIHVTCCNSQSKSLAIIDYDISIIIRTIK